MTQDKKIALLIDAENISRNYRKTIMNELAKYGTTTYRRIYGDFTSGKISWTSEDMLKYSLTPVQQYSNTSQKNKNAGKNSSDITLVIDAMDILYSGNVEGFCIVSSDSDFTKLASRLREAGMLVIGMGEEKTPLAFRKSCEKFIILDLLNKEEKDKDSKDKKAEKKTAKKTEKAQEKEDKKSKDKSIGKEKKEDETKEDAKDENTTVMSWQDIASVIKNEILPELADEDGWASLADIGNRLYKLYSDFDSRNYGFAKLSELFKSKKDFEIKTAKLNPDSNIVYYLIKTK